MSLSPDGRGYRTAADQDNGTDARAGMLLSCGGGPRLDFHR